MSDTATPSGDTEVVLVIRIELTDQTDLEWVRTRVVAVVEEKVEEIVEENRLDGEVSVSWETEDPS